MLWHGFLTVPLPSTEDLPRSGLVAGSGDPATTLGVCLGIFYFLRKLVNSRLVHIAWLVFLADPATVSRRTITAMARKPAKNLTERELEIMQVVWDLGEARLGDVQDALNRSGEPVAVSTVATQLGILVNKGYLIQLGRHGRYVYQPTCSKEDATKNLLDNFLARVGLGRSPSFLIQLLKREKLSAAD